jgi:long-chain acyl-CoA synthetase
MPTHPDDSTPNNPANLYGGFHSQQAQSLFESRYWTQSYPPGVSGDLPPLRHNNLLDLLQECLNKYADLPAFVSVGTEFSYRQIDQLSNQFAGYLKSIGVKSGDIVAIMLPNCVQFPVCFLGALKLGCILTNINPLYTMRELKHQLIDSGATTMVVFENFASTLEQSLKGTQLKHIVITQLGDLLGGVKGSAINFLMRKIKKLVPIYKLPNPVPLKTALLIGQGVAFIKPSLTLDNVILLQYTGGTTGVSKGAMLTHRNLLSNLEQGLVWMSEAIGKDPICVVTVLPLYHIYALTVNCMLFMMFGARNILIANPRDVPTVIKVLRKEKFHVITAVNTLFNAFLNNEKFCRRDFSDLKFVLSGGMALQQPIAERWYKVTRCPISEGFGMTETSPVVTVPPMHGVGIPAYRGNVGLPLPGTEVRLKRDDGLWATVNEPGEICIRGPQVMLGYLNRPEETAETIDREGWLASGDIGIMDEKGFLKIVDRKKDMIIVSGFKVFPNEVEDVIAQHPGVLECAVIGVPDLVTGEKVKLVVVKKESSMTKEDLLAHSRQNLTGYKVPSIVEFRDELPKTLVGKILRRELRDKPQQSQ